METKIGPPQSVRLSEGLGPNALNPRLDGKREVEDCSRKHLRKRSSDALRKGAVPCRLLDERQRKGPAAFRIRLVCSSLNELTRKAFPSIHRFHVGSEEFCSLYILVKIVVAKCDRLGVFGCGSNDHPVNHFVGPHELGQVCCHERPIPLHVFG